MSYTQTPPVLWRSESDTACYAQSLSQKPGIDTSLIFLQGDLGSGKTTFVRHLLHSLGVKGRIKSPTYAIVETYTTRTTKIWHFDFYRLQHPIEFEGAGFREMLTNPGLRLIEWPERVLPQLPNPDIKLQISIKTLEQRIVYPKAYSVLGQHLIT
jgi:tRNA threonylcarbamoyladenosine biosynthesis protein TsaE